MYRLTENMEALNDKFQELGLKKNYYKSFKRNLFWIIVYFILNCMAYFVNANITATTVKTMKHSYICTIMLNWSYYTGNSVDLSWTFTLKFIERKLEFLNILLIKRYGKNLERPIFDDYVNSRLFISNSSTNLIMQMSKERKKKYLEMIKNFHYILFNLSQEINEIYSIHLLLQMTLSFCSLTLSTFGIVLYYSRENYFEVIHFLLKSCLTILSFFQVVTPCSAINKETEKMKLILSDIKNMRKNFLLKEEIDNFYNQILLLPLKFTTFRINTLGNKFILQFLGAVVTYVVILHQFYVK
ncbi:uncharacterized protein LOC127280909 [Leptopilina boulardi]|uniref:uncharacterized protein LOC127280909 n=1 Tax=Leptopilina boulardi TaxID=63433 RepID=UPI0021F624E8|nr:uncharacterized protein LOC127280909 [Leptopilina boulardi]